VCDVFDTDEELTSSSANTYAARRADLGVAVSFVILDTDVTSNVFKHHDLPSRSSR
jgi:hypothetical protein